ncbi:MAG: carbohydrate ABC transporter permease [Chloroflexi bacterium]|nr:carbohydrate ABC transporter permease [Chloroflexota bacterium]
MATSARPVRKRPLRIRRVLGEAAQYAALTIAAAIILTPIYITVVYSLQPVEEIFSYPPNLLVTDPQWDTYKRAFETGSLGRYLINSFIVATAITIGQVITSVLAAYAFAFLRFPFRNLLFVVFLASLMVPWEVTIIPNYQTISTFGWLDSYQGLIVPFLATAFGTFLLRQAFLTVPRDLRDAAAMDGYGHIGFMLQVVVPLSRAAVGALAVFSFLLAWNQYLWPLLITNDDDYRTVQIGLKALVSSNIDEFNLVMAGTVIAAAPILALLILFQKQLIRGLTSGAIKG